VVVTISVPDFASYCNSGGQGCPVVPFVTFCPVGGRYTGLVQQLRLSHSTATVYYSLNSTNPLINGSTSLEAFDLGSNATVCAIAISAEGIHSAVLCQQYVLLGGLPTRAALPPVFSRNGGQVKIGDRMLITSAEPGATLYWSASRAGTVPTACGLKNKVPGKVGIRFDSQTTHQVVVQVFAAKDGLYHSEVRNATFTVGRRDEDLSIGIGSSRIKFKELKSEL